MLFIFLRAHAVPLSVNFFFVRSCQHPPQVYEDGDEEDMEYAEVRKLLNAGNLERTAEATAGVDQTIFHPPPPQTPHNNRNPAMLQGSLSASSTGT